MARNDTDIEALRAENAALKAEIAEMRAKADPMRRAFPAGFVAPTVPQMHALLAIARTGLGRRFHALADPEQETDVRARFCAAFLGLAHMGREAEVNRKIDLQTFRTRCEDILVGKNARPNDIGGIGTLLLAAVAHGDIAYYDPSNFPHDLGLALANYGTARMPDGSGWQRVLATGKILAPTPTPKPSRQNYDGPRPKVYGGGGRAGIGASYGQETW